MIRMTKSVSRSCSLMTLRGQPRSFSLSAVLFDFIHRTMEPDPGLAKYFVAIPMIRSNYEREVQMTASESSHPACHQNYNDQLVGASCRRRPFLWRGEFCEPICPI